MIFTGCAKCHASKSIYYEAGDGTQGLAERWKCEECKAVNFTVRVSFGGETLSEKEFFKRYPGAGKR